MATSPRALHEPVKKTHTHKYTVWSIFLPIVTLRDLFNITFDTNFFFSLDCTMDTGKRHSVGDVLMIYVPPPFISFSYAPLLQLHFQIFGNIYLANLWTTNFFFALDNLENHASKGKGTKNRKSEEKENNGCTLSFYNGYFILKKTTSWFTWVVTFSKIRLYILFCGHNSNFSTRYNLLRASVSETPC